MNCSTSSGREHPLGATQPDRAPRGLVGGLVDRGRGEGAVVVMAPLFPRVRGADKGRGQLVATRGHGALRRSTMGRMTTLAATRHLALDPDRLLPVEPRHPRDRSPALRSRGAAADRLAPRSRAPQVAGRRRALLGPDEPARRPRPLRLPPAPRAGRAARGPRRRWPAAHRRRLPTRLAPARRALAGLPRDAQPLLDGQRARRRLRRHRATRARERRRDLRPHRRGHRRPGLPAARAHGPLRHRGPRDDGRPGGRPPRPPDPARRPRLRPARRPDVPPGPLPRAGPRRLPRPHDRPGPGQLDRHRQLRRLPRRAGGPPPLLQGQRCRVERPQPRRRRHPQPRREGGRPHLRRGAARRRVSRARPRPSAGTCSSRWRAWRPRTAS